MEVKVNIQHSLRVVDLALNQAAKPWKFRSFLVPSVALFVSEHVFRGQLPAALSLDLSCLLFLDVMIISTKLRTTVDG